MMTHLNACGGSPIIFPPKLPVDDGVILWLPFQEGSGDITKDFSGRDNHCNLSGGASWSSSVKGSVLTLDGVDGVGSIAADPSLNVAKVTAMIWSKHITYPAQNRTLARKEGPSIWKPIWDLFVGYGREYKASVTVGDTTYTTAGYNLAENLYFHHFALTYNLETLKFYVDGILRAENNTMSGSLDIVPAGGIKIGYHAGAGTYMNNHSKNLRVYSRDLSADEIRRIHEEEK